MIRTLQDRSLRLSDRSNERVTVRCHFDDEPAILDTFYTNVLQLISEEHIDLDQATDPMKRLLLLNL